MPPNRFRLRPLTLMATALMGATVLVSCGTSASPSPSRAAQTPPSQASGCAWPIEDNYQTANSGLPDSGAWDWGQPFTIHQGTQIIVSGVYPDARYASFTVYSSSETPVFLQRRGVVAGRLPDRTGSRQRKPLASGRATRRTLHAELRPQVSPGQVNVLPLAPAGVTSGVGYLEYRVYLPATGNASHIALPHVTVEDGGSSHSSGPAPRTPWQSPHPAARPLRLNEQPRPPPAPAAPRRSSSTGPHSTPTSRIQTPPTCSPT